MTFANLTLPWRRLFPLIGWLISVCALSGSSLAIEPYSPEPHGGVWEVMQAVVRTVSQMHLEAPAAKWNPVEGRKGRLPGGWSEASEPKETHSRYSRMIMDGIPVLHWEAGALEEDAFSAISTDIGELAVGDSLKIQITLRSPSLTPVVLSLVQKKDDASKPLETFDLKPGSGWTTRNVSWQAEVPLSDIQVVLSTSGSGAIDIMSFSAEITDASLCESALQHKTLAPLKTNLLRTTRFPLGLPPHWMLHRNLSDGDEVVISTDTTKKGPSGVSPLRIEAQAGISSRVMTEPFACLDTGAHVASLAVYGNGKGRLSVCSDTEVLNSCEFSASGEEWTRVGLPFFPGSSDGGLFLMLENEGVLWIDALRVAPGEDATEYETGFAAEVALAATRSNRILFSDEPADTPAARWAVTGELPEGSSLRAKVVNLYDQQLAVPDIELPGSDGEPNGEWALPEFPGLPYGNFRFEAWVEAPDGQRISPYEELVVSRVPRPRFWGQDAPDSPFGSHLMSTNRAMDVAKAIGINWVRLHDAGIQYVGWYFLEPEPGQWEFNDAAIQRYRDHDLMVLGQLGSSPGWASALQRVGPHSWTDRYYQPDNLDEFANYVDKVTRRYQHSIRYWEVWNEPWMAEFWKKDLRRDKDGRTHAVMGDDPAGDYARLQRTAYDAAKLVDPGLAIVGFNTTGGNHAVPGSKIAGSEWTLQLLDDNALCSVDVISYHQYVYEHPGYSGDSLENGFAIAIDPLRDQDGQLPRQVWMTEGNAIQKMTSAGFYYHSLPLPGEGDDRYAADRLVRHIAGVLAAGAKKVFLYSMHKQGRHFDNGYPYRLLVTEDGYPHPTAIALSALSWRIEGKPFSQEVQLTEGLRALVFASDTGWAAVLQPDPDEKVSVAIEGLAKFSPSDIYGNPIDENEYVGAECVFLTGGDDFPENEIEDILKR